MASHNNGGNGNNSEPNSAPAPGRWYNLSLGPSFKDNPSTKFCTLRYEFKPASIDKSQAGSLHKNKENRVSVEFQNNQLGKPKVAFEGSSEDYKENDGVLFFDGESFRLERLHRAVKRLRHVRMPGESNAATAVAAVTSLTPSAIAATGLETRSPPLGKMSKSQPSVRSMGHSVPVEVERIDIGESDSSGAKPTKKTTHHPPFVPKAFSLSPRRTTNVELDDPFSSIFGDDIEDLPNDKKTAEVGPDMNIPVQNASDDEIADVDVSDGEGEKGPNAAEALRAQVNAEEERQTSSSSGTSGSGSSGSGSGSGSGSSSSDSEASDDVSASSGGEVDI